MSGYARVMQERVGAVYGSEGLDLRESFSVKDPYGSNRGLLAPMDLTPYLQYYYMHMERLDVILHNILAQALAEAKGVTLPLGYFNNGDGPAEQLFRCSHYPDSRQVPPQPHHNRLEAHADFGTLTMLYTPNEGLQELRDGKSMKCPVSTPTELRVHLGPMMVSAPIMLFYRCPRVSLTCFLAFLEQWVVRS